jgi:hypothetical protein
VEVKFVEPQQMGFVWLKVLNVSKRNCPLKRSVNLMFLEEREVGAPETWPANSGGVLGGLRRLSCV